MDLPTRRAGIPLLVLLAWDAVATVLAARTFRWSDRARSAPLPADASWPG